MKIRTCYYIFLIITLLASQNLLAQCDDTIILENQNDIDNFIQDYGCSSIQGDIIIKEDTLSSYPITNIDSLQNITNIDGFCSIFINRSLQNIQGFSNLTSVGDLLIFRNAELLSLQGLENLTTINGDLIISSNDTLTDVNILENLTTIGGSLEISDNSNLSNLDGFDNITHIGDDLLIGNDSSLIEVNLFPSLIDIGGTLKISNNRYLQSFTGFDNLTHIGGNFFVFQNALDSLSGFNSVTTIDGYFHIRDHTNLYSISGFNALENIGLFLEIHHNDVLFCINGFTNLTNIGSYMDIYENPLLDKIIGLDNLNAVGGTINIGNNTSLNEISALGELTEILGDFNIYNTNTLENLSSFDNLQLVAGDIRIYENTALTEIGGLNNLTSLGGSLIIRNNPVLQHIYDINQDMMIEQDIQINWNPALQSISGLNGSIQVQGAVGILGNDVLSEISGLNNTTSVGGSFRIEDNPLLATISGFQNLLSVEGYFDICNNDQLDNITGFNSLSYIGQNLNVRYNDNLQQCCIFTCAFDGVQGIINITDNKDGCSSLTEIKETCPSQVDCKRSYIDVLCYYDLNSNGQMDSGEYGLNNQNILVEPDAIIGYTGNNGTQSFVAEEGNYTTTWQDNSFWSISSDSANYTFEVTEDTTIERSFGLVPAIEFAKIQSTLTSGITRCDFEVPFWLSYENIGTIPADGVVEYVLDSLVTFVEAVPAPDSLVNGTLYWSFENLLPTYSQNIQLTLQMPSVEALNQNIDSQGTIYAVDTDGTNIQNHFVHNSPLTCGYDPNDKLVLPSGLGAEHYTLFGDTLEYTVRFQNTGNDTAFNIIVLDLLDDNLDWTTFEEIGSSHDMHTFLNINTGLAEFYFDNIQLPDSTTNLIGSQGFVKFRIQHKENLPNPTVIENTASIFFDSNPYIQTNTTFNTFAEQLPFIATLNFKVFLEGAYNDITGEMNTYLLDQNLLPLQSPYREAPYNYSGNDSITNNTDFPTNTVDWVLIEARSPFSEIVEEQVAFLLADGNIVNMLGDPLEFSSIVPNETYYFVVRHRNHLDILSNAVLIETTQINYDFTTATDQAFGIAQQKESVDGKVMMYGGDFNHDGVIQVSDADLWLQTPALLNTYQNVDSNLDGVVQNTDYDIWIANKAKLGLSIIQY